MISHNISHHETLVEIQLSADPWKSRLCLSEPDHKHESLDSKSTANKPLVQPGVGGWCRGEGADIRAQLQRPDAGDVGGV